jgi:hypothetical protein
MYIKIVDDQLLNERERGEALSPIMRQAEQDGTLMSCFRTGRMN